MPSVYGVLAAWARRTSSSFADLLTSGFDREESGFAPSPDDRIFRLRHWPMLAGVHKRATVYRLLSVMSHRPVNRKWMLARSQFTPEQLDALIEDWVAQGAVEVIDPAEFPPG